MNVIVLMGCAWLLMVLTVNQVSTWLCMYACACACATYIPVAHAHTYWTHTCTNLLLVLLCMDSLSLSLSLSLTHTHTHAHIHTHTHTHLLTLSFYPLSHTHTHMYLSDSGLACHSSSVDCEEVGSECLKIEYCDQRFRDVPGRDRSHDSCAAVVSFNSATRDFNIQVRVCTHTHTHTHIHTHTHTHTYTHTHTHMCTHIMYSSRRVSNRQTLVMIHAAQTSVC